MPKISPGIVSKTLGERLLQRRKELHITQEALANSLGLTRAAIIKYEKGSTGPSVELMVKLADELKCTIDYLCGRVNIPDYVLLKGEQVPASLREKHVDAIEVLRSQVQDDGGLTPAAQRDVLQIVSNAKLIKYTKRRQSIPDSQVSTEIPPE